MRVFVTAGLIAALALPSLASAKDEPPISLAKTTKWEIKYNPDACQLLAGFGKAAERVIFVVTREQPGDLFDLQLYGKSLTYGGISVPMEVTFGPAASPTKQRGVALTMSGAEKLPVIRIANLRIDGWNDWKHPEAMPAIDPAREAKVTAIGFRKPGGKHYLLETGSMAAPLAAMRACTSDLVKTWGYDPAVEEQLTRRATPTESPGNWLGSNDFPNKSLMQGHNGIVRFRIDVDPAGLPSGCRILYRTNPDEFADLSCKLLLKRARFNPALDAAGRPVKSYYINTIRWVAGGEW